MVLGEGMELIVMNIIANAGAARSAAYEALNMAKNGNYKKAKEILKSSDDYAHEAHTAHSRLLTAYANGELEQSDMLISHAQDHLMCAVLAKELITEIIELRETINKR